MKHPDLKRQLCYQLGKCLEYPTADIKHFLHDVEAFQSVNSSVESFLKEFYSKMKRMELAMWQEYYVQSFDLMATCPLYISIHLFGEESFKRAELMAGLKISYERHGEFKSNELPDHLAVILKNSLLLSDEEWSELVAMCVLPVIPKMIAKLEKNANPYSLILKAIQVFLMETEKAHV